MKKIELLANMVNAESYYKKSDIGVYYLCFKHNKTARVTEEALHDIDLYRLVKIVKQQLRTGIYIKK